MDSSQQAILTVIEPITSKYDVPLRLIAAIIEVESNFNPAALGDNGTSIGLFQLHKGGQADKAIAEGHTFESLADPLLNAQYAMSAIASAWDALKGTFNADNYTWFLDFAARSGHPGGNAGDPVTQHGATVLQGVYKAIGDVTMSQEDKGTTLVNYPNLSQLSAKVNPLFDCVPASIADALEFLTGKAYTVDQVLLSSYPANHTGGTSASAYTNFCAKEGVKLFPITGDGPTLVNAVHEQIKQQHPCLITEPDVYAQSHPDWTHVLSMYHEQSGSLTARDPYSTHDVTHMDTEWANLFQFHEIWSLELIVLPLPQHLKDAGWTWGNGALLAPNHIAIPEPFASYIIKDATWRPDDIPLVPLLTLDSVELGNPGLGAGKELICVHTMLYATSKNSTTVEQSWLGKELLATRNKLAQVYSAYQQAQQQIIALTVGKDLSR